MIFADLGDLHSTPQETINYSHFFNSKGEMAFHQYPAARPFFQKARLVADLGCGTGASTIFAHRMTPNATIDTVDMQKKPFPEVVQLLDGKHGQHHMESVQTFLQKTKSVYDIIYVVKASHAISSSDIERMAKHTNRGGYVLQIDGDMELPEEMGRYYEPVWFDKYQDSGEFITIVNALWKKR